MISRFNILLFFLAVIILAGCNRNKDPEEQRLSWSTESPLSIPYHTRFQRYEKKNLVRNPSFETGRTFKLDSTRTSYVIDGWQQSGRQIEWVDTHTDSLYSKDEAFAGFRAVKITRAQAFETDEKGDGITSDFIRVIPGNYNLTLYTKLRDIRSVKGRLGIKMYDAVDIRLLFFDKSKIAINPSRSFPQLNQYIDNSFKSLSLANFRSIPFFGWGKIIGKSADFPYAEGDVPTNAHYVKIFIGLKGTGTMWIDNIEFSYTSKNFSIEERMQAFTDTSLKFPPFIIPAPKKLERLESVNFADPRSNHLPLIVIPADKDSLIQHAAVALRKALSVRMGEAIEKYSSPGVRIVVAGGEPLLNDRGLIFLLGKTGLYEKYRKYLPFTEIQGHSQGYFIYSPPDQPGLVYLDGNNPTGVYYAVLSAIQLIDARQPVFHNAKVIDYPDFENRFYTLGNIPDPSAVRTYAGFARQLEDYKMNGAYWFRRDSVGNNPGISAAGLKEILSGMGRFDLGYVRTQLPDDSNRYHPGMIYAPEMVMPDDTTLSYPFPVILKSQDIAGRNSGNLVTGTTSRTLKYYFMHPVFNNQLMDYSDYAAHENRNEIPVAFVYSGSSYFSVNTDEADINRFIMFAGRKPVFMDNSMLTTSIRDQYRDDYPYYSGKIRLFNIFEPFGNTSILDYYNRLDNSMFWVNYSASSETDIIRLATAADFMWNMRSYNPEYSLWKVLMSRYGSDAARAIVHYADQYGLMLEIESKLIKREQIPRILKNLRGDFQRLADTGKNVEKILGPNHNLSKEISSLNTSLRTRMEKFIKPTNAE